MTGAILSMIAAVFITLGVFAWQPWESDATSGGIQGGGNPTPVPGQTVPPAPP